MISKTLRKLAVSTAAFSIAVTAFAKVSVVTTIPDFAWMASKIGGVNVEATPLLSGHENPHYVDAVPEFIRKVADADVLCFVGLDLEVGYLPPILSRSGNSKVQSGGKGYCDVGSVIQALDKAAGKIDRSMGDVHPSGNPHYYLSPGAMSEAAAKISSVLQAVDPKNSAQYQKSAKALQDELTAIGDTQKKKMAALLSDEKLLVIEYHKEFGYYLNYYGIKSFGSIEEKPGVPPSAGRIAEVALAAKAAGVKAVLATDYNPGSTLSKFASISGIPLVIVPTMMLADGKFKSYADLQERISSELLKKVQASVATAPANKKVKTK